MGLINSKTFRFLLSDKNLWTSCFIVNKQKPKLNVFLDFKSPNWTFYFFFMMPRSFSKSCKFEVHLTSINVTIWVSTDFKNNSFFSKKGLIMSWSSTKPLTDHQRNNFIFPKFSHPSERKPEIFLSSKVNSFLFL